MKTIIVNNGSTSKKYAVYEGDSLLYFSYYEKAADNFLLSEGWSKAGEYDEVEKTIDEGTFTESFINLIDILLHKNIIDSPDDVERVAIRIVAPGSFFQEHKVIDKDYLLKLDEVGEVSPLHIHPVEDEIAEIFKTLPKVKLIAVSDSAFHKDMPNVAKNYALSKDTVEKLELYRYGYHGISVGSIMSILEEKALMKEKTIVCHLGGGSSITAIKNGQSVDTSMGYSPIEGIPMATRSGSVDANALINMMDDENLDTSELQDILYTKSGMKGITGVADTRKILEMVQNGDENADFALDLYTYNIAKHIASYYMTLGGLDTLVFTGTIGERSAEVRRRVLDRLECLGIKCDKGKNKLQIKGFGSISADDSDVSILVIPTQETEEMLRIAKDF